MLFLIIQIIYLEKPISIHSVVFYLNSIHYNLGIKCIMEQYLLENQVILETGHLSVNLDLHWEMKRCSGIQI